MLSSDMQRFTLPALRRRSMERYVRLLEIPRPQVFFPSTIAGGDAI